MARKVLICVLLDLLLWTPSAARQPEFPANFRQYQEARNATPQNWITNPDQTAVQRLLLHPFQASRKHSHHAQSVRPKHPGHQAVHPRRRHRSPPTRRAGRRASKRPIPNVLARTFDPSFLNTLSPEWKLALGGLRSYFFEHRLGLQNGSHRTLKALQPLVQPIGHSGDIYGLVISALPFLAGDSKVGQMSLEATLVSMVRVTLAKHIFGESRPAIYPPHVGPTFIHGDEGFPSGHTSTAFAWATALGEAYHIQWLTYPAATLVGLSRIEGGVHSWADVLAGALLGHLTAMESLRARGMVGPVIRSLGRLRVTSKVSVEDLVDSNPALSPAGSPSAGAGRMSSLVRASYLVGDSLLVQGRYDTTRLVYNSLPGNDVDNTHLELRLDGAVSPTTVIGASIYRERVNFPELGPFSPDPTPVKAFSRDPAFAGLPLTDAHQDGVNVHALVVPFKGWDMGARVGWSRDVFLNAAALTGSSFRWRLSASTLAAHPRGGVVLELGGVSSRSTAAFDYDRLYGGIRGLVSLGRDTRLEASFRMGRDHYPGRFHWTEDWNRTELRLSRRFGSSWDAWIGFGTAHRSAPAGGYSRSLMELRADFSF